VNCVLFFGRRIRLSLSFSLFSDHLLIPTYVVSDFVLSPCFCIAVYSIFIVSYLFS
ncbi:unnamed protein product, partial [Brassica rapa]